jgi:hypothetical protein
VRIKLSRCKFGSLCNPFKIKVEIGRFRLHHGYVGGVLGIFTALLNSQLGSIAAPLFAINGFLFMDDLCAHLRNWLRGTKD